LRRELGLEEQPLGFGRPHAAPGKFRPYPLESPHANYRYFVNAERVRRAYRFERGESRALTAEDLARQLSAAGYLGTTDANVPQHPTR
jgi:hypothetical protein